MHQSITYRKKNSADLIVCSPSRALWPASSTAASPSLPGLPTPCQGCRCRLGGACGGCCFCRSGLHGIEDCCAQCSPRSPRRRPSAGQPVGPTTTARKSLISTSREPPVCTGFLTGTAPPVHLVPVSWSGTKWPI